MGDLRRELRWRKWKETFEGETRRKTEEETDGELSMREEEETDGKLNMREERDTRYQGRRTAVTKSGA